MRRSVWVPQGLIAWPAGPEGAAVKGVEMPIDGGLSL